MPSPRRRHDNTGCFKGNKSGKVFILLPLLQVFSLADYRHKMKSRRDQIQDLQYSPSKYLICSYRIQEYKTCLHFLQKFGKIIVHIGKEYTKLPSFEYNFVMSFIQKYKKVPYEQWCTNRKYQYSHTSLSLCKQYITVVAWSHKLQT